MKHQERKQACRVIASGSFGDRNAPSCTGHSTVRAINGGVFTGQTGSGTYTVNSDCTGSASFTAGDAAGLTSNLAVIGGGTEVFGVVTSAGGTATFDLNEDMTQKKPKKNGYNKKDRGADGGGAHSLRVYPLLRAVSSSTTRALINASIPFVSFAQSAVAAPVRSHRLPSACPLPYRGMLTNH